MLCLRLGGKAWITYIGGNSPPYDPQTNLVLIGEVDWCDNGHVNGHVKDLNQLRKVERGQSWAGMATWNPFWMSGKEAPTAGHWAGWVYAVDADTGVWKWRLKSNYPIQRGMTLTADGVVCFGDHAIILRKMGRPCLTGSNSTMSNNVLRSKELPSCCRVAAPSAPTKPAFIKHLLRQICIPTG